jgi:hypothetical protein
MIPPGLVSRHHAILVIGELAATLSYDADPVDVTWLAQDAVVSAAWMAGGVTQVRDDLDITG